MSLLKKAILALAIISAIPFALAPVQLLEPVDHYFDEQGYSAIDLGKASRGEEFSVVIDRKAFITFHEWFSATPREVSPCIEVKKPEMGGKNLEYLIKISKNCGLGQKSVSFVLEEFGHDILSHKLTLFFDVRNPEELVKASFSDTVREASIGEKLSYEAVVVNNSFASHEVELGSSLPQTYLKNIVVEVPARGSTIKTLEVSPLVYGNESFSFYARSAITGEQLSSTKGELKVYPTLKGKYFPGANGLSVFTISLAPLYYLIGAVFSLF